MLGPAELWSSEKRSHGRRVENVMLAIACAVQRIDEASPRLLSPVQKGEASWMLTRSVSLKWLEVG
jgi:hypothetical protein